MTTSLIQFAKVVTKFLNTLCVAKIIVPLSSKNLTCFGFAPILKNSQCGHVQGDWASPIKPFGVSSIGLIGRTFDARIDLEARAGRLLDLAV